MSETKHTPGPWRARRSVGHFAITEGKPPFFGVVAAVETDENPEAEADALLIAAAPDLLEALAGLLADLDAHAHGKPTPGHTKRIAAARDLVAKATHPTPETP